MLASTSLSPSPAKKEETEGWWEGMGRGGEGLRGDRSPGEEADRAQRGASDGRLCVSAPCPRGLSYVWGLWVPLR